MSSSSELFPEWHTMVSSGHLPKGIKSSDGEISDPLRDIKRCVSCGEEMVCESGRPKRYCGVVCYRSAKRDKANEYAKRKYRDTRLMNDEALVKARKLVGLEE